MENIMMLLASPEAWMSLATLTVLEIILGIDNIIFLSIITATLPKAQQALARNIGLSLALIMRIILLCMIAWLAGLKDPVVSIFDHSFSWRDIIMVSGGLFLLWKGTTEVHHAMEGDEAEEGVSKKNATFSWVIAQIVMLDLVFSLDSVLTAIGMSDHIEIMIAAVVISIAVMLLAAGPVSAFVHRHPTVKMLALSFILLVGICLIADGLGVHIPRGYLYFAIAFSMGVESLNLMAAKRKAKAREKAKAAKIAN